MSEHEYSSLTEFAEDVKRAADAMQVADPPFNPGPTQCRWCKARSTCRALANYNLQKIQSDFQRDDYIHIKPEDPKALLEHELAQVMGNIGLISSWAAAVKAEAKRRLERGLRVPGYKLVRSRTTRKWGDEAKAEAALLLAGVDADEVFVRKIVSVAQAERKLGKDQFAEQFSDLVVKPDGSPTVATEDDSRAECVPPSAATDFSD